MTPQWDLETADNTAFVGSFTSLVLDASGNPVISYWDATNSALKLTHCNDPACTGSDESTETVDNTADVGQYTSLVLDASGNPVISHYDLTNSALKLTHCNDPDCTGSDESTETVDNTADVGQYTSLVLDASGNPVISHYDFTNSALKLTHCNDPDCTGSDESTETVDNTADVGQYTSLVLDASGNPVISYWDVTSTALKLTHCNDPDCTGSDESTETVDNTADVGQYTSLVLDASGNPVISYWDVTSTALKVATVG